MTTRAQLKKARADLRRLSKELEEARADLEGMAIEASLSRKEAEALDRENTSLKAILYALRASGEGEGRPS